MDALRQFYADRSGAELASYLGVRVDAVYAKAHALGLRKSAAFLASEQSGRWATGQAPGQATCFKPGHVPHNKGRPMPPEVRAKCAATMFKAGGRPARWMPVGSRRVASDGYLQQKVNDTGYPPNDWKCVHRLMWEEVNGPIPAGMLVVFRNGNKADVRLDNLELVTRVEHLARTRTNHPPHARRRNRSA